MGAIENEDMDEIDQLLARVPTVRCKCGNARKFQIRTCMWFVYSVLEVNPVNRTVYASTREGEADPSEHKLWCVECNQEVPMPAGWVLDFRQVQDPAAKDLTGDSLLDAINELNRTTERRSTKKKGQA